jgi:hypothetical protein
MSNPQILELNHFKVEPMTPVSGVKPLATYALLSTIESKTVDQRKVDVITRHWEVYDRDWSEDFDLPAWPNEGPIAGKKRWEVSRVGTALSNDGKIVDLGPGLFEAVSHASHVSAEF